MHASSANQPMGKYLEPPTPLDTIMLGDLEGISREGVPSPPRPPQVPNPAPI